MDLDNINDIELLRKIAKTARVQLLMNIEKGDFIFKKGFWYLVEQDYLELLFIQTIINMNNISPTKKQINV